jgi:hypothetical protein
VGNGSECERRGDKAGSQEGKKGGEVKEEEENAPSLSTMKEQSTCSRVVWVVRIEL